MTDETATATKVTAKRKRTQISLQATMGMAAFLLLGTIAVGAFITGRSVEASMDGFKKIQFKIFESNRTRAINDVPRPNVPAELPTELKTRIDRSARQLIGSAVLWVDDGGALTNSWERRALSSLGVAVDTVKTSDEALQLLGSGQPYDAIITDLSRPSDPAAPCYPGSRQFVSAGCQFIQAAAQLCGESLPPVVIYAADLDGDAGQPSHTLGMTNRFDQLVALLLDGLERRPAGTDAGGAAQCARNPLSSDQSG